MNTPSKERIFLSGEEEGRRHSRAMARLSDNGWRKKSYFDVSCE